MNFKQIFISLAISAIIVYAIMNFVITTQIENNPENLITNNSVLNKTYGDLYNKIASSGEKTGTGYQAFTNTTPTQSLGFLDILAIVSPVRIFSTVGLGFYNTIVVLPTEFLGVPEEVMALIYSTLIIFIIIGAWAIWKGVIS